MVTFRIWQFESRFPNCCCRDFRLHLLYLFVSKNIFVGDVRLKQKIIISKRTLSIPNCVKVHTQTHMPA